MPTFNTGEDRLSTRRWIVGIAATAVLGGGNHADAQMEMWPDESQASVGFELPHLTSPISPSDEGLTVVQPGTLAEQIDSPPWHADEMIGPITPHQIEAVEFQTSRHAEHAGWSSSLDVISLWSSSVYAVTENSAAVGTRLSLSHEDESGSGIEFRVETLAASNSKAFYQVRFDQQRLELDFSQRVRFGDSSFRFTFGPRALRYQTRRKGYDDDRFTSHLNGGDIRYIGGGLGVGIDFERPIVRSPSSELSLIGHARYSWLYGGVNTSDASFEESTDMTMSIREVAGGFEWRREWGDGDLIVHSLFEVRDATAGFSPLSSGVAVRIGYSW